MIMHILVCVFMLFEARSVSIYGNVGEIDNGEQNTFSKYDVNIGNITILDITPQCFSTTGASSIDQINNIYFILTEQYNKSDETYSLYFQPYNLSSNNKMNLIKVPLCYANNALDAGDTFISNTINGDILLWCRNLTHSVYANLLNIKWNKQTQNIDTTLISTYRVSTYFTWLGPPILDTKRNNIWIWDSYGSNGGNIIYRNINIMNGTINNELNYTEWNLGAQGIYSAKLDKIISIKQNLSSPLNKLQLNLIYSDSLTATITDNFGIINISNYNYCWYEPYVCSLDDKNGIWYQLMYRNIDNSTCNATWFENIQSGDLMSVDITTGKVVGVVNICHYNPTKQFIYTTCPTSIEKWQLD